MSAEYIRADRPYNVLATCPACGEHEVILVGLASRLERTRAGSEVGLKVKAGKVEHECDQTRITVAPDTAMTFSGEEVELPLHDSDEDAE